KTTPRAPRASPIQASRTFHSGGIVQSSTRLPLCTSCTSSGSRSARMRSVSRPPSPVMLRQIGKRRRISSIMRAPAGTLPGAAALGMEGLRREARPGAITRRDHARRLGPGDPESGIVEAEAPRCIGGVGDAHLVEHLAVVAESEEAVGEASGHVEPPMAPGGELDRGPLGEAGRAFAQVYDHVVDGAGDAGDQLVLGVRRRLQVHAPERPALPVEGDALLYVLRGEPALRELPPAAGAAEGT